MYKNIPVSIDIPTRNRLNLFINAVSSVFTGSCIPKQILISDMSDAPMKDNIDFINLCNLLTIKNITIKYNYFDNIERKRGNIIGHQWAQDNATEEFIFRLDDDSLLEHDCLERLYSHLKANPNQMTVAPLLTQWGKMGTIKEPRACFTYGHNSWYNPQYRALNKIEQNIVMVMSYMYRTSCRASVQYATHIGLSDICGGEEILHSYDLYKNFGKHDILPGAIVHHLRATTGGCRDSSNTENNDGKLCDDYIFKKWGKIPVLELVDADFEDFIKKPDEEIAKYEKIFVFTSDASRWINRYPNVEIYEDTIKKKVK